MLRSRIGLLVLLAGCAWRVGLDEEVLEAPVVPASEPAILPQVPVCVDSVEGLPLPAQIQASDPRLRTDHLIVIRKEARRIQRFHRGQVATVDTLDGAPSCWSIGLGFAPQGHKYREGDGRTPEGWYRTSDKPWSQYYGAIAVHYPNAQDAEAGRVQQRIDAATAQSMQRALGAGKKPKQDSALGGEILIHGGGSGSDWTLGCIAMNNADLDALRSGMPSGMKTDVLVLP